MPTPPIPVEMCKQCGLYSVYVIVESETMRIFKCTECKNRFDRVLPTPPLPIPLSEWKGPWPVLCAITCPTSPWHGQVVGLVSGGKTILEHFKNPYFVGQAVAVPDHWEVVDWFVPAAQALEESANITVNSYGNFVQGIDYCSSHNKQSPTVNSCAEPSCLCQSPQLHDDACAWMAWRRNAR